MPDYCGGHGVTALPFLSVGGIFKNRVSPTCHILNPIEFDGIKIQISYFLFQFAFVFNILCFQFSEPFFDVEDIEADELLLCHFVQAGESCGLVHIAFQ